MKSEFKYTYIIHIILLSTNNTRSLTQVYTNQRVPIVIADFTNRCILFEKKKTF